MKKQVLSLVSKAVEKTAQSVSSVPSLFWIYQPKAPKSLKK
ncbi:MAG: cyclic lactone autoinducer peptide [Bacteroidota bacterium]|nr:cyclic lactone autoinducer peptide [Bacteroidota bacterium]